jgi:hypothetical protein
LALPERRSAQSALSSRVRSSQRARVSGKRLRHEFPSLAGFGVAGEGSLHQRRRIQFGFHGFHQIFGGVLGARYPRVFFLFADFAGDLVARGFGKGVEKSLEAFGLAEFAGECGVDGRRHEEDFSEWVTAINGASTAKLKLTEVRDYCKRGSPGTALAYSQNSRRQGKTSS